MKKLTAQTKKQPATRPVGLEICNYSEVLFLQLLMSRSVP